MAKLTSVASRAWRRRSPGRPAASLLLLSVGLVLAGCGSALPAAVAPAPVADFPGNGAAPTPLLVDTDWLRARLAAGDDLRLLDLSPPAVYRAGHIPGAAHAWWQDTIDRFYPVYGVVIAERQDPGARARLLAALGIADDTIVVTYDDTGNRYAARLVWGLRFFGHARAAVLDGGLAAWRGADNPISRAGSQPPRVVPAPVSLQPGFVIGTRELSDRLNDPSLVLLDVRTPEELADDLNGTIRTGRIPGAVPLPWTATLRDEAGRLKSPEELAALFRASGATPDKEIVVHARFGVEASHTWLVLKLLGYPNVRVYDQGWAEWAAKPELPVQTA
jgi:thiosulfate/3-mercaptopyruvate sulfurtransferase